MRPLSGDTTTRRPRFEATRKHITMSLSDDDIRLIKLLFERRVLSKSMILALFPERGPNAFEKQLKELFDCGYIDRPSFQQYYHQVSGKCREAIYAPLNKGLAAAGIETKTRFDTKNKTLRPWNAEHRLGINAFQIALELAIARLDEALLAFYLPDKAWHVELTEEKVFGYDAHHNEIRRPIRVKLFPDSYFGLVLGEDSKRPKIGFLEYDNGSESYDQLIKKLQKYIQLHDEGILATPNGQEVGGYLRDLGR